MQRLLLAGVAAFVAGLMASPGLAEDTVKVGLIISYSGQFADTAAQMDNGSTSSSMATLLPGKSSSSFARIPAASRPTSPSGWRRS